MKDEKFRKREITVKQNNETLINFIKTAVDKNLSENKVKISNFFKHIFSEGFDCVVFVSRRCYIIYLIFSMLEKWEYKEVFLCTDLGVFANRDRLQTCKKVAIVDDIGYTGKSLRNILNKVKRYVSGKCEIIAIMYAMNKRNAVKVIKKHYVLNKRERVQSRLWLTELQCKQLSIQLVNTILESGMPYTTFVYPLAGKLAKEIDKQYIIHNANKKTERKWKKQYIEISKTRENEKLLCLGNYSVIRTYQGDADSKIISFLPFVFLKSIKARKIDLWYGKIAKAFSAVGSETLAKEINDALVEKRQWKSDAIVYLASFFSCFCSKALVDLCELEQYLDEYNKSVEKSFEGSFSTEALKVIKECDKEYAKRYFEVLFNDQKSIEDIFCDCSERKNSKLSIALAKYINEECKEKDIYETSGMIYSWLKGEAGNKLFSKGKVRAVSLDDLVYILKKEKQYKEKDILLAQIECWDLGIATYRFYYDKRKGLLAKCTPGEMSTTLEMVKYQYIIQKFYEKRYCNLEPYVNMERDSLLNMIIEEALQEGKYTESEMANFRKILEGRNGSLLGLLI